MLAQVRHGLEAWLGSDPATAVVSFVGVDWIEILRFDRSDGSSNYVTLGMSRRPMTSASETVVTSAGPRAELLLRTRERADDVRRQLAVLAAAPAVEGTVFTPDSTVDLGVPLAVGSRCTGGLLARVSAPDIASTAGVVSVLQLLPATSTELAWCRVHGAAALRALWADQHAELDDLMRSAVRLG